MKLKDFVDTYLIDEPIRVISIDDNDNIIYDTTQFWWNNRSVEEQEEMDKDFDEFLGNIYYVWYVMAKYDEKEQLPYLALAVEFFERRQKYGMRKINLPLFLFRRLTSNFHKSQIFPKSIMYTIYNIQSVPCLLINKRTYVRGVAAGHQISIYICRWELRRWELCMGAAFVRELRPENLTEKVKFYFFYIWEL